ncbi:synaptonemal complex protein 1-like isoform X2 [Phymastichus coffea]|nr:synaptonemal complex protein 1-like isoform X2 [Phymastichus coffea]
MEPENLQSVLQEADIRVDMADLQNPTERFMTYLITEYLHKFNIDGNEISKSTPEQLEGLSCPESASDAIKAINLHSAISSFCGEIFLKDLSLKDITSPGPKRARRQIKILFNFLVYVKNKLTENEITLEEFENRQKDIEEMIDSKNDIIKKIGSTIHEQENKLELKQRIQQEIDEISQEIEANNRKSKELECQVKDAMIKHQDASKKCNELKAKTIQMHKVTSELQSKIVKSPEEYAARSKELMKMLEVKTEERQVLNESITRKKLQIKNNESAQELVKDLNEKFTLNTNDTFKKLKETVEKIECIEKELKALKADIEKWTIFDITNVTNNCEENDFKGHEKLLFELDNQYAAKER